MSRSRTRGPCGALPGTLREAESSVRQLVWQAVRVPARARAPVIAALAVGLAVLSVTARAEAVPAFARRYRTSCATCHVVFPWLTPFGEAFRRNGYRFPEGLDEDYQRVEPVSLGAPAYRDLFPRAIWPGELPGIAPVSTFFVATLPAQPNDRNVLEVGGLRGTFAINAASPVGSIVSVFAGVAVDFLTNGDASLRLMRTFAMISPFRHPSLHVRIGRMEPQVFFLTGHRIWGWSCYPWILTTTIGNNTFSFETTSLGTQDGFDVSGVLPGGRFAYALGVFMPPGLQTVPQNVIGRLAYKIGGMRLDGESSGTDPPLSDPAPWRETSATLGLFGMHGAANTIGSRASTPEDTFVMAGGDVNMILRDANLEMAYSMAHSTAPLSLDPTTSPVYTHNFMAQLHYVVFPWFIPLVRYEWQMLGPQVRDRFLGMLQFLVRANIRIMAEAAVQRTPEPQTIVEHIVLNVVVGF